MPQSQRFSFSWMDRLLATNREDNRSTPDTYSLLDPSIVEEELYLPSELNIDAFLQSDKESARKASVFGQTVLFISSWTICILLGVLLGAAAYHAHISIPADSVDSIANAITTAFDTTDPMSQFSSLSRSPGLRETFLKANKWNYTNPPPSRCGNTPKDARAAGCKFGAATFAWYPPACYDAELEEEFLAVADWKWYAEPHSQDSARMLEGGQGFSRTETGELIPWTELPREEVLAGVHETVYMITAYHARHCEFAERKFWRVVMEAAHTELGQPIIYDNYVLRRGHEDHCSAVRHDEDPRVVVMGRMKYFDCIRP